MTHSRAKARKIPDEPKTSYCVKKEASAQRKMRDVKWTEEPVIDYHWPFFHYEREGKLLSYANKCRRNNGIRKLPLGKHHSYNCC